MTQPNRSDFFSFEVHYWGSVANPRPVFGLPTADQEYRPYTFYFQVPPSRDDFAAYARGVPWLANWLQKELAVVLSRSQWPIVDQIHKRADTSLWDEQGDVVGRLVVQREFVAHNVGYDRLAAMVHCEDIKQVCQRLPEAKRGAAQKLLLASENRLREQYLAEQPDNDAKRRYIIRRFLYQNGITCSAPKCPT